MVGRCAAGCGATGGSIFVSRPTPFEDFRRGESASALILMGFAAFDVRLPLRLSGCFGVGAGGGVGGLTTEGPLSESRFTMDIGLLARGGGGGGKAGRSS